MHVEKALIIPIGHALDAIVRVPGSKSLTNRALLIAALAKGQTSLENALFSDDSRYFANALKVLGFEITLDPTSNRMTVVGCGGQVPNKKADLFIGNAGTAARFLSAFLTLGNGEYMLDGDSRMRERPIGDLVSSLVQLGASISPANGIGWLDEADIFPPLKINASGLPGGNTIISGEISSQFLSALLMVSPYAQNPVEINVLTELNSKPYVDMTIGVMSEFGCEIIRDGYQRFLIQSGRYFSIPSYVIEPDASAASYFFAAAAIKGGSVRVKNINTKSKQGDIQFVNVLHTMGCNIREGADFMEVTGPENQSDLIGGEFDMRDIPDTAQTLAAIAPFATSPTHITGIASARLKESDRIAATCAELAKIGVRVEEYPDGMSIYPCTTFSPSLVKTYKDHRMAMAFALIGLRVPGISIDNPGCVSKTFPDYFKALDELR